MNFLPFIFMLLTLQPTQPAFDAGDFYLKSKNQVVPLELLSVYVEPDSGNVLADYLQKFEIKSARKVRQGFILEFSDLNETVKALNEAVKTFKVVYPVVLYNQIPVMLTNDLIVKVHVSQNINDYIIRLKENVNAEVKQVDKMGDRCVLSFSSIKTPSNIIKIFNMISSDSLWVETVSPRFIYPDNKIAVSLTVNTPAITDLGQQRNINIKISLADKNTVVRLDLLPQTYNFFPSLTDLWLDFGKMEVKEEVVGEKKNIDVTIPFWCFKYGTYVMIPVPVSYEDGDELKVVKTNLCEFNISSVIQKTAISDLQPLPSIYLKNDTAIKVDKPSNSLKELYTAGKFLSPVFGSLGLILMGLYLFSLLPLRRKTSSCEDIWEKLYEYRIEVPSFEDYEKIQCLLNRLMIKEFGVSLFTIDLNKCNRNFRQIMEELNNIYKPVPEPNPYFLVSGLIGFCLSRKYD